MKEHYNISDSEFKKLLSTGVTQLDLLKSVKFFDPHGSQAPLTKVSLMYYVDQFGDINSPPFPVHKRIARAMLNSLPNKEKMEIFEYMDEE